MHCCTQRGFTLAEILASVFVLALGLIGAAGMQLHALRTAQQSAFNTAALALATEIADMTRMTLASPHSEALIKPYLRIDFRSGENSAHPTANCYRSQCDADELVEFSIEQWRRRIEDSLPDARAKVCIDTDTWDAGTGRIKWPCHPLSSPLGTGPGPIVVKIGWRDKGARHDPAEKEGMPSEFPPLLVMTIAPYVQ